MKAVAKMRQIELTQRKEGPYAPIVEEGRKEVEEGGVRQKKKRLSTLFGVGGRKAEMGEEGRAFSVVYLYHEKKKKECQ